MRHPSLLGIALALLCAPAPPRALAQPPSAAAPAPLRLAEEGVIVDAGGMGTFTLRYPLPGPNPDSTHALIEKRLSGDTAGLAYAGGGTIRLALAPDGTITLRPASMPADVGMLRMGM